MLDAGATDTIRADETTIASITKRTAREHTRP